MTMFGGTSALGSIIGSSLTKCGSLAIYPYRHLATMWDSRFRNLRVTADIGYKTWVKLTDFTNVKEI